MTRTINRPYAGSFSQDLLTVIREHPDGIRRRGIAKAFPDMRASAIDRSLTFLSKEKLIYNQRTPGTRDGLWFAVVYEEIQSPFSEIASDLIVELQEVHTAMQEMYLARRLQEIFGERAE